MTKKEEILDTALALAAENGLGSVSLSQIAGKVGMQKQSLYNHFASKADLIDALYEYLRDKAKSKLSEASIDYGEYVKGKTPIQVLTQVVQNYLTMNMDPNMEQFYKFVMSERCINKEAARIMVAETERMIRSTKQLFYAMQVQHVMEFENVDMAAFSFTMTIHSMIDYRGDQKTAKMKETIDELFNDYIRDFCNVYGK